MEIGYSCKILDSLTYMTDGQIDRQTNVLRPLISNVFGGLTIVEKTLNIDFLKKLKLESYRM